MDLWKRLKQRKVVQWSLAYAAAAYTLAHAVQIAVEAFDWPHIVVRVTILLLLLGAPLVIALAWYHGHKVQHRISSGELSIPTVLLLIAGTLLWGFARTPLTHEVAATAPPTPPKSAPGAPRTSIAILPFVNLTGDPSKEYLADGMAEEVINTLTGVPGFKVPARTSSFAYKGRNTDVRQIARDLGVGTVLEGSVRSAGDRLRITVQPIDAQDGLHIWSQNYDRRFTDIFMLQDELATAIVHAPQGTMNVDASAPVGQGPPTQDVEAYELYLQGRGLQGGSEETLRPRARTPGWCAHARSPFLSRLRRESEDSNRLRRARLPSAARPSGRRAGCPSGARARRELGYGASGSRSPECIPRELAGCRG